MVVSVVDNSCQTGYLEAEEDVATGQHAADLEARCLRCYAPKWLGEPIIEAKTFTVVIVDKIVERSKIVVDRSAIETHSQ
ncbi:MAG: hypothetical protein JWN70_1419 [Planctomycetaceae bacterium]|nr:hypothetical protein [Planctomycetaceae bacterium]